MQFADFAFGQSDQPHAGKGKLFKHACDILLVSRETIKGFGDNDLKAACPSVLEHLLVPGPQGGSAADGMVRIDLTCLPSLLVDPHAALPNLILNRRVSLIVRRIASVDDSSGHSFLL